MTTQNWPQDPLVPSTSGPESSTADLSTHELGTSDFSGGAPTGTGSGAGSSDGSSTGGSGSGDSKASAAKDQAKQVGQDGKDAAKNVAGTAASEAKSVASEAGTQARNLFGTVSSEVKSQAGTQQQKVTEGIRGISDELRSMAEKSDNPMVSNMVQQVSQRTGSAASWLEGRDAGDILEDVKAYARRKPGTFLALAAGSGLVVGRLTRGLTGNRDSSSTSDSPDGSSGAGGSDTAGSSGRHTSSGGGYDSRSVTDRFGTSAGYTEVDPDLYSGAPSTGGSGEPDRGQRARGAAFVDPADDYPTIPPGTPPVGTVPNDGSLR